MTQREQLSVAVAAVLILVLAAALVVAPVSLAAEVRYHGNVDSKVFHQRSCRWFHCKACTREFATRDEAVEAGYRPCQVCKP